jgi:hypothetical protein
MERAGKKDFSDYCLAEKICIFLAKRDCEKCTGKSNVRKKGRKGLIAKISANNLYQRKLLRNTPV